MVSKVSNLQLLCLGHLSPHPLQARAAWIPRVLLQQHDAKVYHQLYPSHWDCEDAEAIFPVQISLCIDAAIIFLSSSISGGTQHNQIDPYDSGNNSLVILNFVRPIFTPKLLPKSGDDNLICQRLFHLFGSFAFIAIRNSNSFTGKCGVHKAHWQASEKLNLPTDLKSRAD
jgi:hypothetical protein